MERVKVWFTDIILSECFFVKSNDYKQIGINDILFLLQHSRNPIFSCSQTRGLPGLPPLPPSHEEPSDLYQVCSCFPLPARINEL